MKHPNRALGTKNGKWMFRHQPIVKPNPDHHWLAEKVAGHSGLREYQIGAKDINIAFLSQSINWTMKSSQLSERTCSWAVSLLLIQYPHKSMKHTTRVLADQNWRMLWLTWSAKHDIEVKTIDTNTGVVLDTQIDMFLDAEAKVTSAWEVFLPQFIFSDLKQ